MHKDFYLLVILCQALQFPPLAVCPSLHFSYVDVFLALLVPNRLAFITEPLYSLLFLPEASPHWPLGWLFLFFQVIGEMQPYK